MALLGLTAKLFLSLLLWPLSLCLGIALGRALLGLSWSQPRLLSFSGGLLFYSLLQIFFWRPLFMYVMGHELTHALAAVLQGGQADDLHVSTKGGKVKVNKSNFIVNLAPYFFPIYTFLLLLVYWIADERFKIYIIFFLGVSLAFHLALTAYSLQQHQSDISEVGWLFALPFIAILNLLIVVFVIKQVLPSETISIKAYLLDAWGCLLGGVHWARGLF
jgi:hypothetical protein